MQTARLFSVRPSYTLKTFGGLVFNLALISLLLFELVSNWLVPLTPTINPDINLNQAVWSNNSSNPLQTKNQPDNFNLLPDPNLSALPALPAQACDPDPARVTNTEDDGTCNTLRSAVAAAATTPSKTVTFGLPPDAYLKISPVRGGLTVPAGVTIDGGKCSVATPGYTIVGNGVNGPGLTLSGNNTLRNLSIGGFKGKQIANPSTAHHNQLKCTTTANTSLAVPPSDPKDNPSPLDRTVATTLYEAVKFLFLGPNPVQTGVVSGTISPLYVAVLRGKVTNRTGGAIPAVTVKVLNHPEYGKTYSRADGSYDLVVNGGGPLTLSFEKKDYLPLQRQVEVPWQEYKWLPEVALSNLDQTVNSVNLATPSPMRVVRASPVTDQDGTRRETLLIPQGTTATMKLANGTTQPLTTLNIRATEYTVGTTGPQAMPGTLPPNSGYTQATAFTLDEALIAGAVRVDFSQPLVSYLENFLTFTVGIDVPAGYYDREKGVWVAGKNGRVVAIVGIANGLADLDTDGNGTADNNPALGITTAERQQLATLYPVGQTLWRTPLDHFTDWDRNWGIFPPLDALIAKLKQLFDKLLDLTDPDCHTGSIIECQNQTLGERLELNGTSLSLSYRSDRVSGRKANYILPISLSASSVPTSLKRIELEVYVAGQKFSKTFSNTANLRYDYQWDGKDAYGRVVQGKQPVQVRVGYVYDGVYQQTNAFGYNGNGTRISSGRSRQELTLWQEWKSSLGLFESASQNLGGWSISAHHAYDPNAKTLYLGDGTRHSADALNSNVITTIAGLGYSGYSGDNGPANKAAISVGDGGAVGPDGSLYFADKGNNRVRRIKPDGTIVTVAGGANCCTLGDGGPATAAYISGPEEIALAPNGNLYISDTGNYRVRKVDTSGVITTVAGTGLYGYSGDGDLATKARLGVVQELAAASDGSVYFTDSDYSVVRRIGSDGIISTVAGIGYSGYSGDNGPANKAQLSGPIGINLGLDGSIYIGDAGNNRIRRIGTDGIITTVVGTGYGGFSGDGGLATLAQINYPTGNFMGPDGSLYITDQYNQRIRRVSKDGIILTIAGSGNTGYSGDNGLAGQATLNYPNGASVGPDGSLYISDAGNNRIRKISPSMPGLSLSDFVVPSEDGSEVYVFNAAGRHLSTRHALTGAVLLQFGYDGTGRLVTITDADGLITTIERTNSVATSIVGPYGQRTNLSVNGNGYLASLTNPANEKYQMSYSSDGLLLSLTDPRLNSTSFSYDSAGKLLKDQDAAGGYSTLSRIEDATGYTVTLSSALSRTTSYRIQTNSLDQQQRFNLAPTGLQNQALKGTDGSRTNVSPSGAASTVVLGPDPRWTMQAPLAQSSVVTAGTGIVANLSTSRNVTLTNPNDPLSLSTFSQATTINGRKYTTSYNNTTRTFLATSPVGRQVTTTLDLKGRVTSEQAANLNGVNYSYDLQGRLTSLTQGSGANARPTSFSYYSSGPANGYLNTITDPTGRTVSFNYDSAGRVTSQVLPGSRTVAYSYDSKGNLTSLTPPGRSAHTFSYNSVDLPISYTMPTVPNGGTNQTGYSYNLDKQLTAITYPDNQSVSLAYDSAGRLKTLTTPTRSLTYSYNPTTGQLTSIAGSDGVTLSYSYNGALLTSESYAGPVAGSVSFGYDNNFRLTSQSVNNANPVSYQYDNDNLLIQAGSLALNRNAQNGLLSSTTLGVVGTGQTYNGFAELATTSASISGSAYYSVQYTRDNLGRITQKQETIGGVTETYDYSYDTAGRLYQVKKNNVLISSYDYNLNGNRLSLNSTTASYDEQDRLLTYGANSYGYNPRGDLITKTTGISTTTYTYDTESNLLGATLPGGTQISYVVDGQNRRIGKKRNGTLEQGFLYQGQLAPVAQLDGANNLVSRFVYATRANVPDYLLKNGQTYRLILDHLGSVRLVVNTANGTIAQRLDYDEFGNILNDTMPGFQPFGFAGGLYDRDTKLTRFGARDYDAEVGRWTTKDPLGFEGGSANLYTYVDNDPANTIDVTGYSSVTDWILDKTGISSVAGWEDGADYPYWKGWNPGKGLPEHHNRNDGMNCPLREPIQMCTATNPEGSGLYLFSPKSALHCGYKDYRGFTANTKGYQCIYNNSGDRVTSKACGGTFDKNPPGEHFYDKDSRKHFKSDMMPFFLYGN